jgi:hypothetical protein
MKKVLDVLVGRLLDSGNYSKAEKICNQFNYISMDMKIIKTIIDLIEKNIMPMDISAEIVTLMHHKNPQFDLHKASKIEVLELLKLICNTARKSAEKIVINFKISQTINLPYATIENKDPYEVLNFLLIHGKDLCNLAKYFILHHGLDYSQVKFITIVIL